MRKTISLLLLLTISSICCQAYTVKFKGKKYKLSPRCILVDGQLSDKKASKNPYIFKTFQEAVRHLVPGTSSEDRMTILIKPDVYWIDDPDDPAIRKAEKGQGAPIGMHINCPWLQIIGIADHPEDVVLASARGQSQGAVGNFTMFFFHGDGLWLENITLGNYCNVDLEYPLNPTLNHKRRMDAITQAQLAFADGDQLVARHCRFISRLNTCPLNGGKRTLFENCYFESTDDALEGKAVYRHCQFTFYSGKPFYATSRAGAILYDCDFDVKTTGKQYLTKVSSPVILINCRWHTPLTTQLEWTPYPSPSLRCYQYEVTQNGKAITMASSQPSTTIDLDGTSLLSDLSFIVREEPYTLFQKMNVIPIHAELSADVKRVEEGETVHLKYELYSLGDYLLSKGNHSNFTGNNTTDTIQTYFITYLNKDGLQASFPVINAPRTLDAPSFISEPQITEKGRGELLIQYELNTDYEDQSQIKWYRCSDIDGHHPIAVSVSRMNKPEMSYTLQPGDNNHYMMAVIQPKHLRSHLGKPTKVIFPKPIHSDFYNDEKFKQNNKETKSVTYSTDFLHFPSEPQPLVLPGTWTVDGYKPLDTYQQNWQAKADSWYYGEGIDGAKGMGFLQKEKGARLLYTPSEALISLLKKIDKDTPKIIPMSVTLLCDPCKQAGQGFGSATDQYMDVYINFDTEKLSGYALRIIRTTKYANAVDMYLVRYQEGRVEAISAPVSTTCFLTNCTIKLWTTPDLMFHAHVSTTTPTSNKQSQLAPEVNLEVRITAPENYIRYMGTGLQHTGSTGASATMLHQYDIEWMID